MNLGIDVGGTKTKVALFEPNKADLTPYVIEQFSSSDFSDLSEIIDHVTKSHQIVASAITIGVAGPVTGRRVQITNLPWVIDADLLARACQCPVYLLNDLEAHAYGIPHVPPEQLVTLSHNAEALPGNQALIAAGTGLGEAILFWNGKEHFPTPSEGGHTNFAPTGEADIELLQFLLKRHQRVSWERVVSGRHGFRNLYDFLLASGQIEVPEFWQTSLANKADIGVDIVEAAQQKQGFAEETLRWFIRLYGAAAGNLALTALAIGGVYIAGGIAPRILPWLQEGEFIYAFTHKGRLSPLMEKIPVRVILDKDTAIKGAARYGQLRLQERSL